MLRQTDAEGNVDPSVVQDLGVLYEHMTGNLHLRQFTTALPLLTLVLHNIQYCFKRYRDVSPLASHTPAPPRDAVERTAKQALALALSTYHLRGQAKTPHHGALRALSEGYEFLEPLQQLEIPTF